MGIAQETKRYTVAEYYALERDAEFRSEYFEGQIYAMSGGTDAHSAICVNLITALNVQLRGRECAARDANMRLKIQATGLRTYPDAAVYCGPAEFDSEDPDGHTRINPTVVFEVLSATTEAYDRGEKFKHYKKIPPLQSYVLLDQWSATIEVFDRQPNSSWNLRTAEGAESIEVPAINVSLPLPELYEGVTFRPRLSVKHD